MQDLRSRVSDLKPDLIIATGDLANDPTPELFAQARQYLESLEAFCAAPPANDTTRPRLMLIPGNHDMIASGFLPKWLTKVGGLTQDFYKAFRDRCAEYYFRPENVWVFGFDSAEKGTYSGGDVRGADIDAFHKRYQDLRTQYGQDFIDAFKIAFVHHHPLPVNWDRDWRQRWLTLLNAGSFLGAVLHRSVDLVLHGHEHLQANARLTSTLGGPASGQMAIFSLGATLRNVSNPDRNWFSVITITPEKEVIIDSFGSQGQYAFADIPEHYVVRSLTTVREKKFLRLVNEAGFSLRQLASITSLNSDGDARRTVECELVILKSGIQRAHQHQIKIPYTSGDIQLLEVKAGVRSGLVGISIREDLPDMTQRHHFLTRTINYGKTLQANDVATYQYSWWAVDAFAMDESQFEYKYADDKSNIEFTHFVVEEPIENLLLVLQFPEDLQLPDWPEIRVSRHEDGKPARSWARMGAAESELKQQNALRYTESLHTASLRILRPQIGLSYGIEWRVPPISSTNTFERGQINQIVEHLLQTRTNLPPNDSTLLLALLARMADIARQLLLQTEMEGTVIEWKKPLDVSLMLFDASAKKLVTLRAARFVKNNEEQIEEELDYSNVAFDYGDGIAGKAFKTNDYRLYVRSGSKPTQRSSYRKVQNGPDPRVLLSIPIRIPQEEDRPYGIINFASESAECPLARLGESTSSVTEQDLSDFRKEMDERIFAELTAK